MADETVQSEGAFVAQARALVKDLFEPNPWIFWVDFLITIVIAYSSFYFTHLASLPIPVRAGLFIVSGLALYRAALFTHELIHLSGNEFIAFRIAWNGFAGIPLLIPTFLYYTHLEHHRPKHYGTHHDGEYLPLARGPVRALVIFILNSFWVPALVMIRFLILTPLSWMSKTLRALIHRHASALVIDPSYARPVPGPAEIRVWRIQEAICFVYLLTVAILLITRRLDFSWFMQGYAVAVFVVMINAIRTLAAHRYRHSPEEAHSLTEQLLDSINHPNLPWLTEIWAPVGLRFHALHHLFPGLPYHALPEAHRRLMAGLPADSPYRRTNSPGLWASLKQLWRDCREAAQPAAPGVTVSSRA